MAAIEDSTWLRIPHDRLFANHPERPGAGREPVAGDDQTDIALVVILLPVVVVLFVLVVVMVFLILGGFRQKRLQIHAFLATTVRPCVKRAGKLSPVVVMMLLIFARGQILRNSAQEDRA